MTVLGKFALGSVATLALAAHTSALAGSTPHPIHVICDATTPASLCAALVEALDTAQDARSVVKVPSSADPAAAHVTLRYVLKRHTDHLLAGHLHWQVPNGHTDQGPDLELSVMDTRIQDHMLKDYARQLVQLSNIPL